jgi:hypothetical protein
MANIGETDEEFARRLQQAELGVRRPVAATAIPDVQTPLMMDMNGEGGNFVPRNPTVINTRLSELYAGRATVMAVVCTNMPQVLATIIVLAMHWNDDDVCTPSYTSKWKAWSLSASLRMVFYTAVIIYIHVHKAELDANPVALQKVLGLRNFLDAMGLVWFVIGNLWLFGDDSQFCEHPEKSPIYVLSYSMLIISYLQICLPCILVLLLLPLLCFCMPCLIRILARMQDLNAPKGANEAAIESIPLINVTNEHLREFDGSTCPICITDMVVGEQARQLRCRHMFHKSCVDEWLRVNATCPTCRTSIYNLGNDGGADLVVAARGFSQPMELRTGSPSTPTAASSTSQRLPTEEV